MYTGDVQPTQLRATRYYYGADQKLRRVQRYARHPQGYDNYDDLIQEIRYDALGRRILQRTQHEPFGKPGSVGVVERTVWDGDQVLHELRTDGSENSTILDQAYTTGSQYGRVSYVHGGGIDQPLAVFRQDYGTSRITPYTDWRGQYAAGTFSGRAECTGSNGPYCLHVDWPAAVLRTYFDGRTAGGGDWVGSLIQSQQDQSGLFYRRNRYYDPNTGQFTQQDPIGLAGGLNLYGYAGGDPVNFSDPFGLCPQHITGRPCTTIHKFSTAFGAVAGALVGGAGGAVAGTVVLPVAGTLGGGAAGAVAGASEGGVLGLAAANIAVQGAELVGATVDEMGGLGRRLRTFITTTVLIPGGMTSPIPTTPSVRGDDNPTTQEAEQQGRRPRRDDEPERPKQ